MSTTIPQRAAQGATPPVAGGAPSRRDFFRRALGGSTELAPIQQVAYSTVPPPAAWGDVRLRLVRRATMGITPGDVIDVSSLGYQQWLNRQVNYTRIDDSACEAVVAARYPFLAMSPLALVDQNAGPVQNQLQEATIYRAAFSNRQLYQRMVEFWSDHFNISRPKVGYLKVVDDREVIRKHALGRFSDLLVASAHSPAMLAYLDQNQSRAGRPNQNYVRELMELHTLGVDGGYTQQDVDELARVFTGWSISNTGEFVFLANRHDYTAKTVLGVNIPATSPATGAAGQQEGEQMLAFLVNHPSTSRFIARKLLQWFITAEPTSTQIEAIAGVFRATRGDLKLTVRAVLNEGWIGGAPAKLKRPFHLVVSALRAVSPSVATLASMNTQVRVAGQPLFLYETPDGYPDLIEYWSGNLLPRWNFGTTLANLANASTINVDVTLYLAGTPEAAIDMIATEFFGDELSLATRAALLTYLRGGTFNATRMRETMALAIASAEFQWY